MTLKEELEILRGEPIRVFTGDPLDIPCIETSDSEKLCKHPVVSVHMVTYNHEPYIRQAIEGVMMQKTDFEFELVIGEDCSTDRTREICFEYQKRHPDKIRVLWWHQNSYQHPHPAGGNSRRNLARCRGEFIAFCEGDDYWIDPRKLQKQVDVMRKYPNVGFCFCGAKIHYQGTASFEDFEYCYPKGTILGRHFAEILTFGIDDYLPRGVHPITATVLLRTRDYKSAMKELDIFKWMLSLDDTTIWLALALKKDAFLINDVVAVYRRHDGSITSVHPYTVWRDGLLVRDYFAQHFQFPQKLRSAVRFSLLRYREKNKEHASGLPRVLFTKIISVIKPFINEQMRIALWNRLAFGLLRLQSALRKIRTAVSS